MEPNAADVHRHRDMSSGVPIAAPARLTLVTSIVLGVTTIATGLQLFFPHVLSALRRNPDALAAGEWWRIVTPLFVHADGWVQIITNLIGIALVGPLVEGLFGRWRWLALYFIAGIIVEMISYAWEPFGAGASIALCGLIGGLLIWLFKYERPVRTWTSLYIVYLIAGLVGYALGGFTLDVIFAVLFGSLCSLLLRRPASDQLLARGLAIVGLLGTCMLTIVRDNHGPALLIGAGLAVLMLNE